ncbi:MAG TPA: radical SAM protein [Clostridia bacterium]
MKVLLTYTNTNKFCAPPPIGLLYISFSLKEAGHNVDLLDFMFSDNPYEDMVNTIRTIKPDIIGFSVRNLDNQNMLSPDNPLADVKRYILIAKECGIKTVLGGSAFNTYPKEMFEYTEADYGLAGQGEEYFAQLVDSLESGEINSSIPGLVFTKNDQTIVNPFGFSGYKDKKCDWSIVDMESYKKRLKTPRSTAVITKTGCAFKCGFCNPVDTVGTVVIPRGIDEIIYDIKEVKRIHKVNSFFFIDSCFNSDLKFAKELLQRIIDERLNINFSTTIKPVNKCYDAEFFGLYKKAGGYFTMLGLESLCPKMIENYRVPYTLDDILKCTEIMHKSGLRFGLELLFGGPGETLETVEETLSALPKIKFSIFTYAIGVRILPNTLMCDISIKEGLIKGPDDLMFPKFYLSEKVPLEEMNSLIKRKTARYRSRRIQMLPVIVKNLLYK